MFRDWGRIGDNSEDMTTRYNSEIDGIPYDFKVNVVVVVVGVVIVIVDDVVGGVVVVYLEWDRWDPIWF